jgi:hypothetical protein
MNRSVAFGVVISLVAGIGVVAALYKYPDQRIPTVVSVTGGIVVSLFSAYLVYLLQAPGFTATPVPGETKGRLPGFNDPTIATTRWVHVLVKNTSTGFLGGGTAANVGGWVVFKGKMEGRRHMTKWERQPNPIAVTQVFTPGNIGLAVVYDETQVERAKRDTLEPGEVKSLDIALKTTGDRHCYVAVPENFKFRELKNEGTALDTDDYPFDLLVEFRGSLYFAGSFVLRNGEGDSPDSLTVEAA